MQRLPGEAAGEPEAAALLDGDDRQPVVGHELLEQRVFPDDRGDALAASGDRRLQPQGLVPPAAAVGE